MGGVGPSLAHTICVLYTSLDVTVRVLSPVPVALLTMRSRGLLRALLVAGAAIATSSFVGVPAGAGLSRHARASSRATRMMAYKVPEATQEEWVASHVESKAASQLGPSGGLAKAG